MTRGTPLFLSLLLALFAFRVGAQALQLHSEVAWLPPFAEWQSGTLPYGWLLALQVLTLSVMLLVTAGIATGRIRPRARWGRGLLIVGLAYFGFMMFRLISGLTFLKSSAWFDAPIPSVFHLVLAGFVLVLAHYHLMETPQD